MLYSVQQIKFEFLSYIKEFNGNDGQWFVGVCELPDEALFVSEAVNRQKDIWLWKPAVSARAAICAHDYFHHNFGIMTAACSRSGAKSSCVFLYRKGIGGEA